MSSIFAQETELATEQTDSEIIEQALDQVAAAEVLPAPTISIENPVESSPAMIELAWDAMEDAAGYNFELCADNECARVMLYYNNLKNTKVNFKDLKPLQYYWRVSAVDNEGVQGDYTPAQPLLIDDTLLAPPESTPENANISGELDTAGFIGPLPWYAWLVVVAYLLFMLRVLNWYFNSRD